MLPLLAGALLGGGACGDDGGLPPWGPGAGFRACPASGALYHVPLMDLSDARLTGIEPLGHVIAPGHTWPSDHVYLLVENADARLTVRAPGAVRVWQIALLGHRYNDRQGYYEDYTLRFSPCREVQGFVHHLSELQHPALIAAATGPWDRCDEFTQENGEFQRYCQRAVAIDIDEGAVLGAAATLDLGAYDARIAPLGFANVQRHADDPMNHWDYAHTVCPLDAYDDATRAALYAKLGKPGGGPAGAFLPRSVEPRCGTVMQDVAGTLQGLWATDAYAQPSDSFATLSFVHDNFDPTLALLASGGGPLGIHEERFTPTSSGTIDREPATVRATDGASVYCYRLSALNGGGGRMLVRLIDAATLEAETQLGRDCESGDLTLGANVVTYRR